MDLHWTYHFSTPRVGISNDYQCPAADDQTAKRCFGDISAKAGLRQADPASQTRIVAAVHYLLFSTGDTFDHL
ncbi:hypothetical protein [Enterococcus faecalis]|uniref:hypothetical protein n=1 Tax=Enterococcus faecalis TaxID=1351 RepID=UPI004041794B